MSSHHIVREKQEPALLVLGMDNFSDELLGQLLEWSPTVMVTGTMAEKLNAAGIKIDWIITEAINDDIQSDVKILALIGDTVINTAFEFLITNNYSAVNIVTDELDINEYISYLDKINLVIFYDNKKTYPINSGFSKWKTAGEFIELLGNPNNIRVTGLSKTQGNSFKTTADGIFSIQFDQPFIFLAEAL